MRVVQTLVRWLIWLVGAGCAGTIALVVLWLFMRQSPWDFVNPETASVVILREGLAQRRQVSLVNPEAGEILATLDQVRAREQEFSRFLEQIDSEIFIPISPAGESLIIANAGWKALFVRSGILAARSVYNPADDIHFSLSEHSVGGVDSTIYHIRIKGMRNSLSIALVRNILLVAASPGPITAAIRHWGASGTRSTLWPGLMTGMQQRPMTVLSRTPELALPLPCLPAETLRVTGTAWSIQANRDLASIESVTLFSGGTNEGRGLQRLLHSNQYRPTAPALLPRDTTRLRSLLFDDLEELLTALGPCSRTTTRQHPGLIHDWAANELAVFFHKGKRFVYLRVVDPLRAASSRHAPGDPARILTNSNGWTIRRPGIPAFIQPLADLLSPGKATPWLAHKGERFVFGQDAEGLLALVNAGAPTLAESLQPDTRDIVLRRCNFYMLDASGAPPPLPSLIRGLIHDQYGPGRIIAGALTSADGRLHLTLRIDREPGVQANMAHRSNTTAPAK